LGAKLQNNAEIEKRFWKINAVCPLNKNKSMKNEESLNVFQLFAEFCHSTKHEVG
jgi:hypothetical protein